MTPQALSAQAAQSAAQGQSLLSQDQSQAGSSQTDYNNYSAQSNQATQQAQQAAQQEQQQAQYMQGAGSGLNTYNNELGTLENQSGYNPQQLANANQSLFGLTGALNGASQQFNTPGGVGAYGLTAPALASYESSVLSPLQQGVSNANTQVGTLNNELGTLMGGANQATTSQVQSEQGVETGFSQTAAALNQAAQNYQAQASTALQNVQFYSQLASTQGGLNASEQASYASAINGLASAQNALAQIQTYAAQANQANTQAGLNTAQTTIDQQAINAAKTPSNTNTSTNNNGGGLSVQPALSNGVLQGSGLNLQ